MRNRLKRSILSWLAARGKSPATVAEIAWGIRLTYPKRGLYGHLARYSRWALILPCRTATGVRAYRIGPRGRARLAWFRRNV